MSEVKNPEAKNNQAEANQNQTQNQDSFGNFFDLLGIKQEDIAKFLDPLKNELKNAIKDAVKDAVKEFISELYREAQIQTQQNPNPGSQQVQQIQAPDLSMFLTLAKALGIGGGGGIVEEMKKFAELKAVAEAISGGGMSAQEIFNIYRAGMQDMINFFRTLSRTKGGRETLDKIIIGHGEE